MKKLLPIIKGISVRLILSVLFTIIWYFINQRESPPSIPLALCGAVFIASSWFSYLKSDGFIIFNKKFFSVRNNRTTDIDDRTDVILDVDAHKDYINNDMTVLKPNNGKLINLLSGVILVAVSFIF